jgi:hypothetical protein
MGLLWSLVAAAMLCTTAAGWQAVRLVRECEAVGLRADGQVAVLTAERDQALRQIEAQKILLAQAKAWMEANKPPVAK